MLGLGREVSESDTLAASVNSIADAQGWWKATSSRTYVELLSCFNGSTIATLSSPTGQRIILSKVARHFHTYPFLLHTVLALTAAHLTCVSGRDGDFVATASYHTQQALRLYSERLQCVKDRAEMDAMLATCFMLTALFYLSHDEFNTTESWIFAAKISPASLAGRGYFPAQRCFFNLLSLGPVLMKALGCLLCANHRS